MSRRDFGTQVALLATLALAIPPTACGGGDEEDDRDDLAEIDDDQRLQEAMDACSERIASALPGE